MSHIFFPKKSRFLELVQTGRIRADGILKMLKCGALGRGTHLGFNGVSRQKSAALYHRGEGVAPISKIPPPPPSPSLSSPFFSPNPQRNLTLPAPLAVSSPTLLTLSLYSPTSVIGPDLGQGNFPLSLDSRCRKARDTRRRKARDTRRRKARDTRY